MNNIESSTGEIVMYQPDETIRLEVRMDEETEWSAEPPPDYVLKIVAIMQTGINHHGKRQAAMKITSKLNTINAPVNIDTSLF